MEKLEKNPVLFVSIMILAIALSAVGYYYAESPRSNKTIENKEEVNNKIVDFSKDSGTCLSSRECWEKNYKMYINKEAGFQMTQSEDAFLGGGVDTEKKEGVSNFIFYSPGQKYLIIKKWPPKSFYYNENSKSTNDIFLAENSDSIFTYNYQDIPFSYGAGLAPIPEWKLKVIQEMIKTFKLIN